MRGIVKYAFIVLVAFLIGCAGVDDYKMGKLHLESEEYGQALSAFETALRKKPDFIKDKDFQKKMLAAKSGRARELFLCALDAADIGKFEEAKGNLDEAIVLDPSNKEIQDALKSISEPEAGTGGEAYAEGLSHYIKKDWYKANVCFTQAIELRKEHVLARLKRLECNIKITEADEKFQLVNRLISERKLTEAITELEECLAISPHHPRAEKVLEEVEKTKARAGELYKQGKDNLEKADYTGAEKAFAAANDMWIDYEEAQQELGDVYLKQADAYEKQNLIGHALMKCVEALQIVPESNSAKQRCGSLRDKLIEPLSCKIGLLITDALDNPQNAAKVEAGILAAQHKHKLWPPIIKVATREDMKISGTSPDYLVSCNVLELSSDTKEKVEHIPRVVKVGTKQVLNPDYLAAREQYERAQRERAETYDRYNGYTGLSPDLEKWGADWQAWGSKLGLNQTPIYKDEDVYKTQYETVTRYHQSGFISVSTKISEPAEGNVIFSDIVSTKDSISTTLVPYNQWKKVRAYFPSEVWPFLSPQGAMLAYGFRIATSPPDDADFVQNLIESTSYSLAKVIIAGVTKAKVKKLEEDVKHSIEEGNEGGAKEALVKLLMMNPNYDEQERRELCRKVEDLAKVRKFVDTLSRFGLTVYEPTGYVGIWMADLAVNSRVHFQFMEKGGLFVLKAEPGFTAERAGLKPSDIIMSFDGKRINNPQHFAEMVRDEKPGKIAKLKIWRDKREIDLDIQIAQRPYDFWTNKYSPPSPEEGTSTEPRDSKSNDIMSIQKADGRNKKHVNEIEVTLEDLGFSVKDLTSKLAQQYNLESQRGVIVSSVNPNSKAERVGIAHGDLIMEVNRETVASIKVFKEKIQKAKKKDRLLLLIRRKRSTRFMVLRLKK